MSPHIRFSYHRVNGQEDDDRMTPEGQLHKIERYLSLPSVRRFEGNNIHFTHGCGHQQILDKTE